MLVLVIIHARLVGVVFNTAWILGQVMWQATLKLRQSQDKHALGCFECMRLYGGATAPAKRKQALPWSWLRPGHAYSSE